MVPGSVKPPIAVTHLELQFADRFSIRDFFAFMQEDWNTISVPIWLPPKAAIGEMGHAGS